MFLQTLLISKWLHLRRRKGNWRHCLQHFWCACAEDKHEKPKTEPKKHFAIQAFDKPTPCPYSVDFYLLWNYTLVHNVIILRLGLPNRIRKHG